MMGANGALHGDLSTTRAARTFEPVIDRQRALTSVHRLQVWRNRRAGSRVGIEKRRTVP
jgi:hypothetical protein